MWRWQRSFDLGQHIEQEKGKLENFREHPGEYGDDQREEVVSESPS